MLKSNDKVTYEQKCKLIHAMVTWRLKNIDSECSRVKRYIKYFQLSCQKIISHLFTAPSSPPLCIYTGCKCGIVNKQGQSATEQLNLPIVEVRSNEKVIRKK